MRHSHVLSVTIPAMALAMLMAMLAPAVEVALLGVSARV